jgi:histidinol-phosphate aminotransferase
MSLDTLVRDNIRNLKPYSSARDEFNGSNCIQLDANESPFASDLNRYPDPYQKELKKVFGELRNIDPSNVIVGNGSDEIIDLIIRAFCEPNQDRILGMEPSYGMYQVSAAINSVSYDTFELNETFNFEADQLIKSLNKNTKIVFLCSPNNPTGNLLDQKEIEKLLEAYNGIVVLDEAYIDFSDSDSWINTLDKHPYLIVIQTLSKSFALASLRVGFGICSSEIISVLNKIKPPYNVNSLSQTQSIQVLSNPKQTESQISVILQERETVIAGLQTLKYVKRVFPSSANFVLVKFENSKAIFSYLIENQIVVRDRSNLTGCENCLRISIGTPNENSTLLKILKAYKS